MEQINQPRGAARDITTHDEPVIYEREAETPVPLTCAEAEQHNPYTLLTELRDHALTVTTDGERPQDSSHHLAELALSSAVVAWWSRWQPLSMHRAFAAGASLAEVAAAAGTTEAEAYDRWERWAERQSKVRIGGRLSVEPSEVAAIRRRLAFPHR
ncbi:hypothetical protein RB614_00815 [Phytohabitans sp. ZYX-F-186]|uniref:Uncharacterized protein n=1 Tax=Phytohabitans maris TaxID=3071409 RepID=A0ABU0Z7N8_9ACTN|nr:hypothetical protein [Phytohabitans sp. ZYX-F-186]MDQ7903061.1 hypothetical protein [Phytohabitans sp. ZYX-F-186]